MRITPLILHMKSTIPLLANRIAGGVSFKSYLEDEPRLELPAVYIEYQGETTSSVFPEMQLYEQLSEKRFSCFLVLSNTADSRGQAAQDKVVDFEIALFASILNYQYLQLQHPIEFAGSNPYYMDRARYIHKFDFKIVRRINSDDGYNMALPDLVKIFADWDLQDAEPDTYPNAQTINDNLNT